MIKIRVRDVIAFSVLVIIVCLIFLSCSPEDIDEYMDENYNTEITCYDASSDEKVAGVEIWTICRRVVRETNMDGVATYYFSGEENELIFEHEEYFNSYEIVTIQHDSLNLISIYLHKIPDPILVGSEGCSIETSSGASIDILPGTLEEEISISLKSVYPNLEYPLTINSNPGTGDANSCSGSSFMIDPLSILFEQDVTISIPIVGGLGLTPGDTIAYSILEEGDMYWQERAIFGIISEDTSSVILLPNPNLSLIAGKGHPPQIAKSGRGIGKSVVGYGVHPVGGSWSNGTIREAWINEGSVSLPTAGVPVTYEISPYIIWGIPNEYRSVVSGIIPDGLRKAKSKTPSMGACDNSGVCSADVFSQPGAEYRSRRVDIYKIYDNGLLEFFRSHTVTYPNAKVRGRLERTCHQGTGGDQ